MTEPKRYRPYGEEVEGMSDEEGIVLPTFDGKGDMRYYILASDHDAYRRELEALLEQVEAAQKEETEVRARSMEALLEQVESALTQGDITRDPTRRDALLAAVRAARVKT